MYLKYIITLKIELSVGDLWQHGLYVCVLNHILQANVFCTYVSLRKVLVVFQRYPY